MILAVLMIQFVGGPFAFFFGRLAGWIGAKRAVFLALAVYTCISILGYYMRTTWQFYLLGFLVGTVQAAARPQPVALCVDDSPAEVVGVLRVLGRLREIRRYHRPRGIRLRDQPKPGRARLPSCR